jgi:vesicle-fusing ATPase
VRVAEIEPAAPELAYLFRLPARTILAVAAEWRSRPGADATVLRELARDRARVGFGALAQRLEPRATWQDLVLPEAQLSLLHDIAHQLRHRGLVYDDWGFAASTTRGLGVSALFAGESGTGKTMAAEVLAGALGLDLYRIDLAAVVSKYIGETEKNLGSVFDAAEASGAVLLFDEADALFGKRSEVRDSHDRYANLEVAYLLQRMEAYRGLAILTTNLRTHVDRAFLRRLRFVVQFPFPDAGSRAEIWRRSFPPAAPTASLDPEALAGMQLSGGSIRSIVLSAAFAAAEDDSPITPAHVLRAARLEAAKSERTLTDAETAALRAGGGS